MRLSRVVEPVEICVTVGTVMGILYLMGMIAELGG